MVNLELILQNLRKMNPEKKSVGHGAGVGSNGGTAHRGGTSPTVTVAPAGSGPGQAEGRGKDTVQVMPGGFGNERTQGKNFVNVDIAHRDSPAGTNDVIDIDDDDSFNNDAQSIKDDSLELSAMSLEDNQKEEKTQTVRQNWTVNDSEIDMDGNTEDITFVDPAILDQEDDEDESFTVVTSNKKKSKNDRQTGEKQKESNTNHIINNSDIQEKRKRTGADKRAAKKQRDFEINKLRKAKDETASGPSINKIIEEEVQDELHSRPSYATLAADNIIFEFRYDDDTIPIDQLAFDYIDANLVNRYCEFLSEGNEDFDMVIFGGINNRTGWVACNNNATAKFVKHEITRMIPHTEEIKDMGISFIVYQPQERLYRSMKGKIHTKFYSEDPRIMEVKIRQSNKIIKDQYTNPETGIKRPYHFKVLECIKNKYSDMENGYFTVSLQVDEKLFKELIQLKGRLKLGMSYVFLSDGGMITAVKADLKAKTVKKLEDILPDDYPTK
jgi:hypothetical protein